MGIGLLRKISSVLTDINIKLGKKVKGSANHFFSTALCELNERTEYREGIFVKPEEQLYKQGRANVLRSSKAPVKEFASSDNFVRNIPNIIAIIITFYILYNFILEIFWWLS